MLYRLTRYGQGDYLESVIDRRVPRKPRPVGGIKGHTINEDSFPGSPRPVGGGFEFVTYGLEFPIFSIP